MSIEERRQEERAERRRSILDATERVVARRGFEKLTMGAIAKEARLSRSLLYVYFDDLDDLVMALTLRAFRALRRRFERAVAQEAEAYGLMQIRAIGVAYVTFHRTDPDYFDALARFEAREVDPRAADSNEAKALAEADGIIDLMVGVIERGMADGSIRADLDDPVATAFTLWAYTHGLIQVAAKRSGQMRTRHGMDADALIDHGLDMAGRSMASDEALPFFALPDGATVPKPPSS
jgi:AcrR family transcriptional regulator